MIFSTAGAEISDVHEAWRTIRAEGNNQIAIMHCVAKYPAPPEVQQPQRLTDACRRFS